MTSFLKTIINSNLFLLLVPLILSAYTHLWNPLGFPVGPSYDENIYLRRTMNVLTNLGPQESELYDHPYFLQIFLGGILLLIGYPNLLHPIVGDVVSVDMLYLVPKLIMGILSIVDTFLIYKIAECYYNNKNDNNNNEGNNIRIAFIASILFAVMPITSMVRTVWLEPIQLPFLLSSVLFATYVKKGSVKEVGGRNNTNNRNVLILTLLSGIFLGLAIFTKIPAFTFALLVGYLLFSSLTNISRRNFKTIIPWLVTVFSIPSIWPVYALSSGHFSAWLKGIFFQTHRRMQSFLSSIKYDFFNIDPVFMAIGFAGFIFTGIIKRDLLIMLWVIPFMVFLYAIGFVSYWHLIPIFPALSIAAAKMIADLSNMGIIANKKKNKKNIQQILPFLVISGIAIFGVLSTTKLISENTNVNSPYFEAAAFVIKYLQDNEKNKKANNDSDKFTIISNPFYSWIPFYVFNLHYDSIDYYDSPVSVKTKKVLLISDPVLIDRLNHNMVDKAIKKYLYGADKALTFDDKNPHTNNKVVIYIHQ
jgi:hypothetical protein